MSYSIYQIDIYPIDMRRDYRMLEYIILGFLMNREMSGYDLKQYMVKSTSNFFDAGYGSIYPALKRMEAKGLIGSREIVDGGKYKKVYSIKEPGKAEFMDWLDLPVKFSKDSLDHLVKIFFYVFLPKEKATENLKTLILEVESALNEFKKSESIIKEKCDLFQYSTLVFGIGYYSYIIDWCNDLVKQLKD
jgi:DNA-binding PadR family transcriptional regulator